MTTVTFEIEQEQVDSIIRTELAEMMGYLENDLARCLESKRGSVFDMDWEADAKELKKHIKSFKRVLKYYGEDL